MAGIPGQDSTGLRRMARSITPKRSSGLDEVAEVGMGQKTFRYPRHTELLWSVAFCPPLLFLTLERLFPPNTPNAAPLP